LHELLSNEEAYQRMAKSVNPYGDGTASNRIAKIVGKYLSDTI
jgi:UDP-N-acetylglucosamine 2-epimerase (non-hydrolysing)